MRNKTLNFLVLITWFVSIIAQNETTTTTNTTTTNTTTTPPSPSSFNYKTFGSDWVDDCQKTEQSPINIQVNLLLSQGKNLKKQTLLFNGYVFHHTSLGY
jgi:hypothetical protein